MRAITTLLLFLASSSFAQLTFTSIGSEPALCRISGDQSGNGIVYAAVTGGVQPYTYIWVNLANSQSFSGSTWGGLNPGYYKITASDNNGAVLIDTVHLDSINPIANFAASSSDIVGGGVVYWGTAPATVTFENLSTGIPVTGGTTTDTSFYWQFSQYDVWNYAYSYIDQQYSYYYAGNYGVTLVAKNKNNCVDTAYVEIYLDGPAAIEDLENIQIQLSRVNDNLLISSNSEIGQKMIVFYDLQGKIIQKESLFDKNKTISWNHGSGLFVYECVDGNNNKVISRGKFVY